MTDQEIIQELRYRYNERLAMLGIVGEPSNEMSSLAMNEASGAVHEILHGREV